MDDRGGLENRCPHLGTVGSNPTPSAGKGTGGNIKPRGLEGSLRSSQVDPDLASTAFPLPHHNTALVKVNSFFHQGKTQAETLLL